MGSLTPNPRLLGTLVGIFLHLFIYGLTLEIVIEMRFETGDEKLKDLELSTFAGAGRFVVEQGKPVVVEYKLSKLVKGD